MWNKIVSTPRVYPFLLAGVLVSTAGGFALANKFALPFLNILFAYPVMYSLLKLEQRKRAFVAMLFWALFLGVVTVIACVRFPAVAERSILNGADYVREMFHWIKTGEGTESEPLRFVPQHLFHFAAFVVLSLLTAGILSLFMGAILMNYMSFYVGSLILASHDHVVAALMGWHPWAAIRVASFVILGVILAEPGVCRLSGRYYDYEGARPYFWAALTGVVLDMIIKALLAPWWGLALRKLIV